jgi:ASC-1-like (ASCH) protein
MGRITEEQERKMKEGDKLIIARRSLPVLEILLDRADSLPESDTANPQNDVVISLEESDKGFSTQRKYRYTRSYVASFQTKQEAN